MVLVNTKRKSYSSINILSNPRYPQAGDTVDLRCEVTGATRGYQVEWSKVGQAGLGDNVLARGNVMRFTNLERSNNGLYRHEALSVGPRTLTTTLQCQIK